MNYTIPYKALPSIITPVFTITIQKDPVIIKIIEIIIIHLLPIFSEIHINNKDDRIPPKLTIELAILKY